MLLVGIALRSLPGLDIIGANIDSKWSATLRKMALVVILTRAGLGLDPKALREMSLMVLRLGILPNVVEMTVVAVVSHFLLQFPWLWSFMLGFILAGVSPSVVVPCMLNLSDNGYGINKGIPTLVIAGLSVDNVISISGFGVMLGIIFSEGSIVWQALKGPIEVMVGLGYALFMGSLTWYLPNRNEKGSSKFKFVLLFASGLLAIFGSMKVGFGGAGPIACLGTAFVAGVGWRKQGCMDAKDPIKKNFNFIWQFFLPLLFGLIGTEIKVGFVFTLHIFKNMCSHILFHTHFHVNN
ncbi:UNVERIFIED_CONTAM: hypothetical protein GTU68_023421 [Idotea baltica]|nr:hypothetical protein [Idotea baltica]